MDAHAHVRRFACIVCRQVWRQDTSRVAQRRTRLTRPEVEFRLRAVALQCMSVSRVASALGLFWHIATNAVLAIAQATLLDILATCPPPTLEVDDSPCVLRSRARSARYLVDGPGWSGAGPAAVGMGVLPPSSNDPRPLCVVTRQAGRQVRHGDHRPAPYATSVVRPPALGRGSAPVQEDPQDSFSAPRTGADRLRL